MLKLLIVILATVLIQLSGGNSVLAQSLARSVISSAGASVEANNIQLGFSVGEVAVTSLEIGRAHV